VLQKGTTTTGHACSVRLPSTSVHIAPITIEIAPYEDTVGVDSILVAFDEGLVDIGSKTTLVDGAAVDIDAGWSAFDGRSAFVDGETTAGGFDRYNSRRACLPGEGAADLTPQPPSPCPDWKGSCGAAERAGAWRGGRRA
jgi:hypothetical protein